ncbi:hypothetical protein BDZ89DRAFT_237961 [Hymenopellis radicata]|nr:hypothetical protein BDZ89DRAFT_237961 [Hymenopellis radicata]
MLPRLSQPLDVSTSPSEGSDSRALSSTFSMSPPLSPDMKRFSAQSGDSQRSNSPSPSPDTNSGYPKYYNPATNPLSGLQHHVPLANRLRTFFNTPGLV